MPVLPANRYLYLLTAGGDANEQLLFHGSAPATLSLIARAQQLSTYAPTAQTLCSVEPVCDIAADSGASLRKHIVLSCRGGLRHARQPRERDAGAGRVLCLGCVVLPGGLCTPGMFL